ncbi:MAG: hypothetical protein WCH61_01740, partial [bacterium]
GGIGLKLFAVEELRDFALNKQRDVAKHNLAPVVGDSFTLPESLHGEPCLQWKSPFPETYPSGPLIHGYITESADTARPVDQNAKQKVIRQLKSIKALNTPDNLEEQDENFGYIGDRLVIIDFDIGSWN